MLGDSDVDNNTTYMIPVLAGLIVQWKEHRRVQLYFSIE